MLELLERRIGATAIHHVFLLVATLACTALTVVGAVTQAENGVNQQTVFIGLIALAMGGASWAILSGARSLWPPKSTRVYRMLASDGADVTWAHLTTGAYTAIKVYFFDGDVVTIRANGTDAKKLLAFVIECVPDVIVGFGPEQQAEYSRRVKAARPAKKTT